MDSIYRDDFYDAETDNEADYYFDDDENAVIDSDDADNCLRVQKNYTILKEADIQQCMDDDVKELSTVLSIPKAEASILLLNHDWSTSSVHDAWFANEFEVRKKVGLLLDDQNPVIEISDPNFTCGICFESYTRGKINYSAICGHSFCEDCWRTYISTSINDGPGCLKLRCPVPSCRTAVYEEMVIMLASDEEKKKYSRYLVRFYVDQKQKSVKWCPAPNCEFAVDLVAGVRNFEVLCLCSHRFCGNCIEDAHRPVDCETVKNWISKNKSDAENVKWITAFTKSCPKCQRPIEKNQGCMHMTCTPPCRFEFCWLCLQDWSAHGYTICNGYKGSQNEAQDLEKEKEKTSLMRYAHYYERWANHKRSMQKAMADLQLAQNKQIQELSSIQNEPEAQLMFLTEAWQQIIECRRVLCWTYAYAFYLARGEEAKKLFFEYLQHEAESNLERLHDCAELELIPFLNAKGPSKNDFTKFRVKLADLTRVTKTFFENLVTALENGLSDVSSKKQSWSGKSSTSSSNRASKRMAGPWTCDYCTYVNVSHVNKCLMCHQGFWSCENCTNANPRLATACKVCSKERADDNSD